MAAEREIVYQRIKNHALHECNSSALHEINSGSLCQLWQFSVQKYCNHGCEYTLVGDGKKLKLNETLPTTANIWANCPKQSGIHVN